MNAADACAKEVMPRYGMPEEQTVQEGMNAHAMHDVAVH